MGTCVLREKANVIGDCNGVVYDPFIELISIKDCVPDSYLQHHQEACCYVADTVCSSLSHVQRLATPWTVALQAPLSMEFSRILELSCHSLLQGIFPTQRLNPGLHCRQILYCLSHQKSLPDTLGGWSIRPCEGQCQRKVLCRNIKRGDGRRVPLGHFGGETQEKRIRGSDIWAEFWMAAGRQPGEGWKMHVLDWGAASAQTLGFHECGGFEEENDDQCGWNGVCKRERRNWLVRRAIWGLILGSVGENLVIPEL